MAQSIWKVSITERAGILTTGMWVEILSYHRPMQHQIREALQQKYGIQLHGTIPTNIMCIEKM